MTLQIVSSIIVLSCLSNMVADLFLSSGRDYRQQQTTLEQIRKTPEKNLLISAILGLVSLGFWQTPLYFLQHLTGTFGGVAMVSFAVFIGSIMAFHPICCMCLHLVKADEAKEKIAMQYIKYSGWICFLPMSVFTVTMIVMGVSGELAMQWYHYLGLPLFAVIIIQFGLGRLLKKVPYFSGISGTLSMMISLLLLVHLLHSNL